MSEQLLRVRELGLQPWQRVSQWMHHFTDQRHQNSLDEVWLVQHPAIFTQGQAGKDVHLLNPGNIPVVQSDRGGQVTYHGPGQQVMYVLIDIRRRKLGVRELVTALEQTVIDTLAEFSVMAKARTDAPGVYVGDKKICSLGLRIRKGCSFHGLALNIEMDLTPFQRINPCGYAGLEMTQLSDWIVQPDDTQIRRTLVRHFVQIIGFNSVNWTKTLPSKA